MISFSQALRAIALAVVLTASSVGYAETSIPARTGWVQDTTGTLTASDISQLSVKADQIAKSTGAVVVSLMVDTTDGEVIDDYTMRVAEAWHPGKAGVDKAAVLVIAKADKKWAIKTTRELGVTFTDVQAKVTLNKMRDYLKMNKGNFVGAMNVFYDQANKFSQPEVAVVATTSVATQSEDSNAIGFALILVFVIIVIIGFAVYKADRDAEKRKKEEQDRLDNMISAKRSYPSFNAYGSSVPPPPRRASPPAPRTPRVSSRVERRSEKSDSSDLVDSLLDAAVLSSVFSSSSKAEESKKESSWSLPDFSSSSSDFDGGGASGGFD